jgi:plasmid stability protein
MATQHKPAPSEASDKYMLRLHDDGLRKKLKVRAAQNERTLNGEILFLIKRGLRAEEQAQGVAQ